MEKELVQFSERLGERLEKLIRPLVEPEAADKRELERAEQFRQSCLSLADRVWELLELPRDLTDNRVLVLENGTGYLARRLADGDVDVVSAAPTSGLARLAGRLNPYPNIIYRAFNPYPTTEEFDLIIGTGIIAFYPRETALLLIQSLTGFCRRKFIIELPEERAWYRRLFDRGKMEESVNADLELSRFSRQEIIGLVENTCGLLISEKRLRRGRILLKALRKVHRQPWL